MVFCDVNDPSLLFESFWEKMSEDYEHLATFGFERQRLQFPIRLAFSFAILKSQGQTLSKVAVWLQEPYFGHGQFNVAASRVGNPNNIKFFLPRGKNQSDFTTHNVVYQELLQ